MDGPIWSMNPLDLEYIVNFSHKISMPYLLLLNNNFPLTITKVVKTGPYWPVQPLQSGTEPLPVWTNPITTLAHKCLENWRSNWKPVKTRKLMVYWGSLFCFWDQMCYWYQFGILMLVCFWHQMWIGLT